MILRNFTRFFDKTGSDLNLKKIYLTVVSLYDNSEIQYESYSGTIFFPVVSTGLIESQNLYLLQEVTGPTTKFELRSLPGEFTLVGGNSNIEGLNTDFTSLTAGNVLKIDDTDYTVDAVYGATSMSVTPSPFDSLTTSNVHLYDYINYSQLRSAPDTYIETLHAIIPDKSVSITQKNTSNVFFLYDVNYTEDVPYIEKSREAVFDMEDGSADSVDDVTGRIGLNSVSTIPTQVNIGISSDSEYIYQETLYLNFDREYRETLSAVPSYGTDYDTFYVNGTSHELLDISTVYLQGGISLSTDFYSVALKVLSVGTSSGNTYIRVEKLTDPPVTGSNYAGYSIRWTNVFQLAELTLYGEVEGEDERLKVVLQNFGKKIDYENEHVFRDSDVKEELTDFVLLNKKRKELLLEGDNIYPYLGSYRALINIINYFGYYDVRIKEYFLNVDTESSNFGKYFHVIVPRNDQQRAEVKAAWNMVPSKVYKKTSLFGLFYDINTVSGTFDEHGIPEVVDSFDFTPEEVLIKLFGLKELLKKEYLPLNARIYDITGEGIYFKRIRVDTWADSLNHLVLDIGKHPEFSILPENESYITDLRKIDSFYKQKFIEQGLAGFLGTTAQQPYATAENYSFPISTLYGTYLDSYRNYIEQVYDENGNFMPIIDSSWEYMPPDIDEPLFNEIAARTNRLPDDKNIVVGAPVLLESFFNVNWEDSIFNWSQLSILGPTGSPLNINLWSWESVGRGEYIDMRWTIEKHGENGFFYDSGRKPIDSFVKSTQGATAFSIPGKITVDVTSGSISSVYISSAGYGYVDSPAVHVPSPDLSGTTATISLSVSDGYIIGATWTGGTGYTFAPSVWIAPPPVTYENDNRLLHAVSLPYSGDYDIGLYNYDITNNYTVQFKKYVVKNKEADFSSSYKKNSLGRKWEDFLSLQWTDANAPWYYPNFVNTKWEEAIVSWESLDYSTFKDQTLYEFPLDTKIYSIDRNGSSVVLLGNLLGELQNSLSLSTGDFIFLSRDESSTIVENLEVPVDSIGYQTKGLSGSVEYSALLSGVAGDNFLSTSVYDTTTYINEGDSLWVDGEWYNVLSVGSTSIDVSPALATTFTDELSLQCPSDLAIPIGYSGSFSLMERFSRLLVTDSCEYNSLNPSSNFYEYLDGLTSTVSTIVATGDEAAIKHLIVKNSSIGENEVLYVNWGLFAGTYALEITNMSISEGNTLFRLSDMTNELFLLDGNFSVKFSKYDVDYAETKIGAESLKFDNVDELTWEENPSLTWFGAEFHGDALCGYILPFVAPGGSITIDEEPSFFFSGNSSINNTRAGLTLAAEELNSSYNSGVSKYNYSVLPDDDICIVDSVGATVDFSTTFPIGATVVTLTGNPSNGSLKIPATLSATIGGGSVLSVSIDNPGYGYETAPVVVVDSPGCSGTTATVTCIMTGLPLEGTISSVVFTPGSGYTQVPDVFVDTPVGYRSHDNYIWTGKEWVEVLGVDGYDLLLGSPLVNPIDSTRPLLPYQFHKQLYLNTGLFQQFYYFIHGKAKNPSNEMLSYVNFDNGLQSEWVLHPDRTYTYSLGNSLAFLPYQEDLTGDRLYNKWIYEGADYPPLTVPPEYSSDKLSNESRIPFSSVLQSPFSFIDTVISDTQNHILQFTPVVFHLDNCKIPGKTNAVWTVKNTETGDTEVMVSGDKMMWNFSKPGKFSVTLDVEDANGNKSSVEKVSLFVVE